MRASLFRLVEYLCFAFIWETQTEVARKRVSVWNMHTEKLVAARLAPLECKTSQRSFVTGSVYFANSDWNLQPSLACLSTIAHGVRGHGKTLKGRK